jgi:lysozyme|tara:strand:- start:66 stop:668 length:603 start_codon:yes stop_codon:yes gene_type:complete
MEISEAGIEILIDLETNGQGPALTAYKDGAGYSIGYGHNTNGPGNFEVNEDTTITEEEAEELLKSDLEYFEGQVNRLFGKVNLSQNEYDALVIALYNRPTAVKNSGLVSAIVSGDEDAIEDAWYNSIPEKAPKGIRSKRVPAELELFFSQNVDTPESTPSEEQATVGEAVPSQDNELRGVMAKHMLDVIRAKTGTNVQAE